MRSRRRGTAIWVAVLAALLAALGLTAIALGAPAPATPTITASPPNPSASTSAAFSFTGETGSTFECKLDGALTYTTPCPSPKSYAGLALGPHTFRVHAVKGGKTSGDAVYTWTIAVPSTPTIVTKPANPTMSTGAAFTFTTNASNATFECKLDPAPVFTVCASAISYSGLSASSHTFTVRAVGAPGLAAGPSAPASYTWLIDTSPPPAPVIDPPVPVNPTNVTSASFTFHDTEGGVSFLCNLDSGAYAACTSPKSYSGLAAGSHTFRVKARDAAGNEAGPTTYTWTVDLTPPPTPMITSMPPDPSPQAESTFVFTDSETPVTFQCSIENGPFLACTSPITFTVIVDTSNNGQHQFAVRAVDPAGNISGAATYKWKVDNVGFAITGNAGGLLYPGLWRYLPLQIVNPHNFTIYVESLTVSLTGAPGSCPGGNVEFQQSNASSGSPIVVSANSTITIPVAQQPRIRLIDDLLNNQDSCKGASFSLAYSGVATK